MRRRILLAASAGALVVAGFAMTGGDGYEVKVVMPSAAMLSQRTPVWINGQKAGQIDKLEVRNGKAVATLSLAHHWGPLHTGTRSRVEWVSAVGERVLTLYPGKRSNPEIPEGGMFDGPSRQVEVDQVLSTLDAPTRARLASLVGQLDQTVAGHEDDLNASITTASGAVDGLGEVLRGVGEDGPAIRALVTQLRQMTDLAGARRDKLAATVRDLTALASSVAGQQAQISETLRQLPDTLTTARTTLGKVPEAADATTGLLHDLRPATSKLPGVSADLAPTLVDLRPTVAELRPLLGAADQLLGETPGLLDTSHAVIPDATQTLAGLGPAISFLRPYTPEGVGGLTNWGQAFAPYDGAGHTWAGLLAPGINALNETPVPLPSSRKNPAPLPGAVVGQPWTDATGAPIK